MRDELRSVEAIQDLAGVEALAQRLPELVGAPLSINNLAEDLRVAHKTAEAAGSPPWRGSTASTGSLPSALPASRP